MKIPFRTKNSIANIVNNTIIDLPTPSNISYWWNIGSLLGACLIMQLISGIMLAIHYSPNTEESFNTLSHMMRDVNMMWFMRIIHANGASLFFLMIYVHIARGMFFKSYTMKMMWLSGTIILLMLMATAFLGYVLPWGQMSFWAATVITNLVSAIPYLGKIMVEWIWGGYSVNNPTLTRFYTLHFFLPLLMSTLVLWHIMILHNSGSSNPLGLSNNQDKAYFHPLFSYKDLTGVVMITFMFGTMTMAYPYSLIDPENFIMANPLVTPTHIQPEWYFLFAYAILRSIPNKLGGVLAMILSIISILLLTTNKIYTKAMKYHNMYKLILWMFISTFIMLSYMGSQVVEAPYELLSQLSTMIYFMLIIIITNM